MNNVGIKDNPDNSQNDDEFFTINYSCGGEWSQPPLGTYTATGSDNKTISKSKVMQECLIHNNYIIARRPDKAFSDNSRQDGEVNFNYCVANNYIYSVNNAG